MKKYSLHNTIALLLLVLTFFLCFVNYNAEKEKRILKTDLIELADVKYGIFNIDEWKEQIVFIVSKKIDELRLSDESKEKARVKIERFLNKSIDKFEDSYRKENGILKNIGASIFSIFDELKEQVPTITNDILEFLDKKENADGIKKHFKEQLDVYSDKTFQKVDYSHRDAILIKYQKESSKECQILLSSKIDVIDAKLNFNNLILFIIFILIITFLFIPKSLSPFLITTFATAAFSFLFMGVLLPMIDIDARISTMEFQLLGEPIVFENQVLYFKSKSILEMAKIMLFQENFQVLLVGILVLTFSVIFPILKLISTLIYTYSEKLANNKVINFITFKTGKWTMADVMVIAIFMTYIGFDGILTSQLQEISNVSKKVNIITTNHSELQNGFYYFLGFVLLGLAISSVLKKKVSEN